jgi:hypothetical protein
MKSKLENKRAEIAAKMRGDKSFSEKHQEYLKNTNTVRKYGGVPSAGSGKVYDLKGEGKKFERKINSPNAKAKRALRNDIYEGHSNKWGERELARLNRK